MSLSRRSGGGVCAELRAFIDAARRDQLDHPIQFLGQPLQIGKRDRPHLPNGPGAANGACPLSVPLRSTWQ